MISQLDAYFSGTWFSPADYQRGCIEESIAALQHGDTASAHRMMVELLRDKHLNTESEMTEAMTRAVNWIDLGFAAFALRDLEEGLKP